MDEDFGARAGPALGFLDETGAIRIHPGESFPQGRAELGFADPAVIVRIEIMLAAGAACATDLDPFSWPADHVRARAAMKDDFALAVRARTAGDEDHGPAFAVRGMSRALAALATPLEMSDARART